MMRRLNLIRYGLILALGTAGCRRPVISSAIVPKEIPETAANAAAPATELSLGYSKPETWKSLPADQMNVAKFAAGDGDKEVSIKVTPLAGMGGRETMLVNLWRTKLGQPELNEEGCLKALIPVAIGNDPGQMFDLTGTTAGESLRILTAFLQKGEKSWFFKLQGTPEGVEAQKAAFVEFLKTVQFRESGI